MADRGDISDEEPDIDIESDDDDASSSAGGGTYMSEAERKAHHNMLERKRRDHIKESFSSLRDCLPDLKHEKTSRAMILKKATEYIQFMTSKNGSVQKDIENIRKQNQFLKQQVQLAERARANGNFSLPSNFGYGPNEYPESSDSDDSDPPVQKPKKLKTGK